VTTPYYQHERRAARARADAATLVEIAHVLRQVGEYDQRIDARRGDVSFAQAALIEACSRHLRDLPSEVATSALRVADAVHRATGQRRPS
jgi:predicted nucleic acid-binding protein